MRTSVIISSILLVSLNLYSATNSPKTINQCKVAFGNTKDLYSIEIPSAITGSEPVVTRVRIDKQNREEAQLMLNKIAESMQVSKEELMLAEPHMLFSKYENIAKMENRFEGLNSSIKLGDFISREQTDQRIESIEQLDMLLLELVNTGELVTKSIKNRQNDSGGMLGMISSAAGTLTGKIIKSTGNMLGAKQDNPTGVGGKMAKKVGTSVRDFGASLETGSKLEMLNASDVRDTVESILQRMKDRSEVIRGTIKPMDRIVEEYGIRIKEVNAERSQLAADISMLEGFIAQLKETAKQPGFEDLAGKAQQMERKQLLHMYRRLATAHTLAKKYDQFQLEIKEEQEKVMNMISEYLAKGESFKESLEHSISKMQISQETHAMLKDIRGIESLDGKLRLASLKLDKTLLEHEESAIATRLGTQVKLLSEIDKGIRDNTELRERIADKELESLRGEDMANLKGLADQSGRQNEVIIQESQNIENKQD